MCWGSSAVAARGIVEGPKGEVILLGWRSNMERSGLFSSKNRFSRHDIQLGINLSQDILAGVTCCGWPIFCGLKCIIIFRYIEWFSEKTIGSLNCGVAWLQISKDS